MPHLAKDLLYEKFEQNIHDLIGEEIEKSGKKSIAIAVSGGSDSIALFIIAHKWAKIHNINLVVISVDHHLREQSSLENEYISTLSNKLGHQHFILHFDHENNFSNLQARCREGRYTLMTSLCLDLDILTIMTAHHLDDYIENYYIRSERKSSIFGLSSSNIHWYNNVRIVRPLYNIPKKHLTEYLTTNNIKWFEDESNSSEKYHRNVIRKKLAQEEIHIKNQIIDKQLDIDWQVNKILNPKLIACIAESMKIYQFGFATVDTTILLSFSNEITLMAINYILIIISGKNRSSRSNSVKVLVELLQQKVDFIKTLNGCVIKRQGKDLIIYREFGRNVPQDMVLNDNELWDNRFRFNVQDIRYYVSYLTLLDYKSIQLSLDLTTLQEQSLNHHKTILFTLPVIKKLEKVIAMPHISYYDDCGLSKKLQVSFSPCFVSRFTHFC